MEDFINFRRNTTYRINCHICLIDSIPPSINIVNELILQSPKEMDKWVIPAQLSIASQNYQLNCRKNPKPRHPTEPSNEFELLYVASSNLYTSSNIGRPEIHSIQRQQQNLIVEMFDFLKQSQITLQEVEKSIKELPLPEKVKTIAIYKRYKQIRKIEEEMQAAIREVEKKYLKLDEPVLNSISDIVSGKRGIAEAELKDMPKYLNEEEVKEVPNHLGARKIEGYWSKCLSGSGMIKENMGKDDEQLLNAIDNIHVVDEEGTDNFTIVFSFRENDIIKNKELTKKFYLQNSAPVKSESTVIEWTGKNLTLKEIKKKQKNKKTGQQRVVTKLVKAKSFFNFFANIDLTNANPNPLEANEDEMKLREELEQDFEIGGVLVDEVLPYSLEYYLGIEHEGDDAYGDEEEEEENSDDEEDNKKKPHKKDSKSKSKSKSKGKDKKDAAKPEEKPECKQQ